MTSRLGAGLRSASFVTFAIMAGAPGGVLAQPTQFELGAFHHDISGNRPDWKGERAMLVLPSGGSFAVQLDMLHEERGVEQGQFAMATFTRDMTKHFFVLAGAGFGSGTDYLPEQRLDVELGARVPKREMLSFTAGGSTVRFQSADVTVATLGVKHGFGWGSVGFRHSFLDSSARTPIAKGATGSQEELTVVVSKLKRVGDLELKLMDGRDELRTLAMSGKDAGMRARVASLAWRRAWTRHLGTHVEIAYGDAGDLYQRRGGEVRLTWR